MQEHFIKRLKIIDNALGLDDFALALSQLDFIKQSKDLRTLCEHLEKRDFYQARCEISRLLKRSNSVSLKSNSKQELSLFIDEELLSLRQELQALQDEYAAKQEQKEKLNFILNRFNDAYYQHLGGLLGEILALQREILEQKLSQKGENEGLEELYKRLKEQEEELKSGIEESQKQKNLSAEDLKSLKSAYKKAAKLCHPDLVAENFKKQAQNIFSELSDAYQNMDLAKVEELLSRLENEDFSEQRVEDKERIKAQIAELKKLILSLDEELEAIQNSAEFKLAHDESLWGDYFSEQRAILEAQKSELLKELNE